jgi:hypothetical protein
MPSATDRLDFGPPRDAGSLRAFGLALLVHVLLIAALTWGVNWKRSDQTVSFEAVVQRAPRGCAQTGRDGAYSTASCSIAPHSFASTTARPCTA